MLKVSRLSKQMRGKKILNDIEFEVDHGKIAIFLGSSGVGKSTLLRVLNKLEPYETGTLTLDEQPLALNSAIGMVFQHFNLFEHLSVQDNITLALIKAKKLTKSAANAVAEALLARYGLSEKAHEPVSRLSGGQKQRLAIARTLALDPKVVCLDEPTSALDPRLTAQVASYITDLASENRIVLLTTHDTQLVKLLDAQLFLLEAGKVAETSSKKDLFAYPTLYPKLQAFLH